MIDPQRTPAGVPSGGQFATGQKAEGTVALAARTDPAAVAAAVAKAKVTGRPVAIPGVEHNGFMAEDGHSCGDTSLTIEPSNRQTWATGNDQEPFISVTSTSYVVARLNDGDRDLDYDDWVDHLRAVKREQDRVGGDPAALGTVRYAVENRTEWVAHHVVDEPGGTEIRSDYTYEHGSALNYLSLATAEAVAQNTARNEDWTHYAPENWKA